MRAFRLTQNGPKRFAVVAVWRPRSSWRCPRSPAGAQTTNPEAEFVASADHNTTLPDGRPALTDYVFEIYNIGASAPFHTIPLGKPTPGAGGLIQYRLQWSPHRLGAARPGL